jgi:integrase
VAKILTSAAVRKFVPTSAKRAIRDAGSRSLYLIIYPTGARAWQLRFRRPGGKIGKMIIGPVDLSGREIEGEPVVGMPLSLSAARQLAAMIHRDRAQGRDPIADHKAKRGSGSDSFGAAVVIYIKEYAKPKIRNWEDVARLLGLTDALDPIADGLADRWASKAVSKIDGHDVHGVVDEARRVSVPGIKPKRDGASESRARKLNAALSGFFSWCLRKRLATTNPCAGVHTSAPSARDRVLTADEIRAFWQATDAVSAPFASVFKLLLLTGCRLNEIAGLRWTEVSDAEIRLPGSRTKNHKPHVVPLAPTAQKIIAETACIEDCEFAFSTNGKTPISGWSKAKTILDDAMKIPAWRLHDLRRTAVTGLAELGVSADLVELIVNHISGSRGGVAGTYNRSERVADRRAALGRWDRHLTNLVEGKPAIGKRR